MPAPCQHMSYARASPPVAWARRTAPVWACLVRAPARPTAWAPETRRPSQAPGASHRPRRHPNSLDIANEARSSARAQRSSAQIQLSDSRESSYRSSQIAVFWTFSSIFEVFESLFKPLGPPAEPYGSSRQAAPRLLSGAYSQTSSGRGVERRPPWSQLLEPRGMHF